MPLRSGHTWWTGAVRVFQVDFKNAWNWPGPRHPERAAVSVVATRVQIQGVVKYPALKPRRSVANPARKAWLKLGPLTQRRSAAKMQNVCAKWRCRGALVVGGLVVLVLLHTPILRGLAWCLIVDEPSSAANYVLVVDGDRCFDVAAQRFREGSVEQVLVQESIPGRLARLGVLPTFEELSRRELAKRGVAADRIALVPGQPESRWEAARVLNAWLQNHPEARVAVLSSQFSSKLKSHVFDRELDHRTRTRLSIVAIRDRRFDESNWWRSKTGIKSFAGDLFSQCYAQLRGEEPKRHVQWDPEEYEEALFR